MVRTSVEEREMDLCDHTTTLVRELSTDPTILASMKRALSTDEPESRGGASSGKKGRRAGPKAANQEQQIKRSRLEVSDHFIGFESAFTFARPLTKLVTHPSCLQHTPLSTSLVDHHPRFIFDFVIEHPLTWSKCLPLSPPSIFSVIATTRTPSSSGGRDVVEIQLVHCSTPVDN